MNKFDMAVRSIPQETCKRLREAIWSPVPTRRLRFLLVLLGLAVLFSRYVPAWNALWDYSVYYEASRNMLEGESPYVHPDLLTSEESSLGLPYLYSPVFARLLTPLALVNYMWSGLLWVILKCLCLEACVFLVIGLLGIPFSGGAFAILHFLVLVYEPVGLDVGSGNVATLETTVILGGLLAWRVHRPILGGFLLPLPIIFKPTCLLILLYALHRRAWDVFRGAGLAVIFVGLCTIPDWRYAVDLLQLLRSPVWARFWDELVQSFYNFSAVTVVYRVFDQTYFTEPIIRMPWLPPILGPLVPISIFILTAWAIARSEGSRRRACEEELNAIGTRENNALPISGGRGSRRATKGFMSGSPGGSPSRSDDAEAAIRGADSNNKPLLLDHSILSLVLLTTLLLPPRLAGYSLVWTLLPLGSLTQKAIIKRDWILGFLTIIGFALIQMHVEPQHVKRGLSQLWIDHYFWGLLFLYAGNITAVGWLGRDLSKPAGSGKSED
jgi:hypothetical protein